MFLRGVNHKLKNLIGKRRLLYQGIPQIEVQPHDVLDWEKLEKETAKQSEMTQRGLSALTRAMANQVEIDDIWKEYREVVGQVKKHRIIRDFEDRIGRSRQRCEIEEAKYEMLQLLESDAARERQARLGYLQGRRTLLLAGGEDEPGDQKES